MIEDRGVGGESRDRQLFDVFPESSAVEQLSGNVVEPKALAQIMQLLCRFHIRSPYWTASGIRSRLRCVTAGTGSGIGSRARPEVLVSSANQRKACSDCALSAQRHCQLPCARPGMFMRASAPKSNTSCSGAIVSPAAD